VDCLIPIQVKITTDVIGSTRKVLCGYNFCAGDEVDRVRKNKKEKLDYLLQL
jgi:hypothetical protein